MMLISAQGISVRQGGVPVISDVSMALTKAEIVTIHGLDGAGKPTLPGIPPLAAGRVTLALPGLCPACRKSA